MNSILVTGATGTIGSLIVERLAASGTSVKALVRSPGKVRLPAGIEEVVGDMTDVASMRAAFAGVRTLFLLNAVTPDEVTQAVLALNLARAAGVQRLVYLSVIHADTYANVPHFTGKHAVERMIEDFDISATILRPAYFMQNDAMVQSVIKEHGVYPMPIGSAGVWMVDVRDIADVAAHELLARHASDDLLPRRTIDIVGPESLSGERIAGIWSDILGRPVQYGGDDLESFEQQLLAFSPGWMAYDMRLMMGAIQRQGMKPSPRAHEALNGMLGRPMRTYRDAAKEMVAASG